MLETIPNYVKVIEGTFPSSEVGIHIYQKHFVDVRGEEAFHVLFLHGAVEHQGYHEEFFKKLLYEFRGRIIISTMDHIGHGLSGGPRAHVENFQVYLDDVVSFYAEAKKIQENKRCKTTLVAHSLGALIGLKLFLEQQKKIPLPFDGAVWISPCVRPRQHLNSMMIDMARKVPRELQKIRLTNPIKGHDLTSDHKKAMQFNTDPLISHFITIRMGLEIVENAKKIVGLSYYLNLPSLFLVSENDQVVDPEATKLFAYGVDKRYLEMKTFPEAKHDLLNETCRKQVVSEIIKFIKSRSL